ncbi:MAG TPA: hypothetical protein VGJ66_23030 [Pyrinomonadaceae bacterium]|jgi:hypothetical protein
MKKELNQTMAKKWHPGGVAESSGTPPGYDSNYALASGGLRHAATTGYFRPNPAG